MNGSNRKYNENNESSSSIDEDKDHGVINKNDESDDDEYDDEDLSSTSSWEDDSNDSSNSSDSSDDDDDESSYDENDDTSSRNNNGNYFFFRNTNNGGIRFRRQQNESSSKSSSSMMISQGSTQYDDSSKHSKIHNGSTSNSTSTSLLRSKRPNRFTTTTTTSSSPMSISSLYKSAFQTILSKKSTAFLVFSIILWLYIQFLLAYHDDHISQHHNNNYNYNMHYNDHVNHQENQDSYDRIIIQSKLLQQQRQKSALEALGQAALPFFQRNQKKRDFLMSKNHKHDKIDKLPKHCYHHSWQTYSFPTCNKIHEIDLKHTFHMKHKHSDIIPADLGYGDKSEHPWSYQDKLKSNQMGYLGSGLWRQVWKVDDVNLNVDPYGHIHNTTTTLPKEYAVLKMMKSEHEIDHRNFDRHRRDSLVMERLTSSKNVVSIYGFCGNTVLTEYGGMTLDDYIYEKLNNVTATDSTTTTTIDNRLDRNTPTGRIKIAHQVMKGLSALHDIQDGPIVHADIQAKQFLIQPNAQEEQSMIKINDFNRCRILPKHNITKDVCKLKIPSAPGAHRSPEEYELLKIDEKIDLYSVANVLYGILTGRKPYENKLRRDIKKNVMKGQSPDIENDFRKPGTYDALLVQIIENAYSLDPKKRWSAKEVVEKLERVLDVKSDGGMNRVRRRKL